MGNTVTHTFINNSCLIGKQFKAIDLISHSSNSISHSEIMQSGEISVNFIKYNE